MTALFTALMTNRARSLWVILVATSVALAVTARGTPWFAEPPVPVAETSMALDPSHAIAEREPALSTAEETATITELRESFDCGIFVGVSQVRYGDRFGIVVPCLAIYRADGLQFAIGDTQTLRIDDRGRVTAITWRGKTWHSDDAAYGIVKTPATAVGNISWSDDGRMHYRAPGWAWH